MLFVNRFIGIRDSEASVCDDADCKDECGSDVVGGFECTGILSLRSVRVGSSDISSCNSEILSDRISKLLICGGMEKLTCLSARRFGDVCILCTIGGSGRIGSRDGVSGMSMI